jgi:threonine aldolase
MSSISIDLRSDTVTKPSEKMLDIMHKAPLGDDVFGEDPSINHFENKMAELFGMDTALFVPSGTMSNQIAIKVHTNPGEDIICDYYSHIYQYEGGGIGMNAGCSVSLIHTPLGQFSVEDVKRNIYPDDIHKPISKLVSIENTCNKGGGTTWNLDDLASIKKLCMENNLKYHLDGARLFNAIIANQHSPKDFGTLFDTISICMSKGLGAPVGSILLGSYQDIHMAKRYRKALGGGMRQAGSLAAAAEYALDHHVERLSIDHQNAHMIESTLQKLNWVKSITPVETNIIIFEPHAPFTDQLILDKLKENGILASSMGGNKVRFVTHLDIDQTMMKQLIRVLQNLI